MSHSMRIIAFIFELIRLLLFTFCITRAFPNVSPPQAFISLVVLSWLFHDRKFERN